MASMVQLEPTVPLAVKNPDALMLPQLAVQFTGALAVNCWVWPCAVFAETGVMIMGETSVMLAAADDPEPSFAVAVTVQLPG